MPILNTKLLLRLLAAILLLGGGLVILHTVQAERVPDALLWQANNAAEKGKMDKAIFYMKQYLEFRPDDYDTAIKLADLMVERSVTSKDISNAHFLYERVLREAPQRTDVARKLVTLCIRMGRHADALTHAEKLLRETPNDGMLLSQVAECQVAQNRPAEARQSFEKAITNSPDNIRAYDLCAHLLNKHFHKPQEARTVLDRLTQANPGQAEAFLVRARFLKNEDKTDDCMRDLDRVFLLDPENGEALVLSAEILQARGEVRRAREALQDAIATYPRFTYAYRALSWLEQLGGNQADARATLERGVAMLPDAPDLLTPLADIWIEQGELDKVLKAIETLEARKDSSARVNYVRGRMLMKQAKWNEALAVLETLRSETVALPGLAPQLNLLIAGCHERRGDRDSQIEALKRALASDPKHLAARVALANAHLDAGRLDDAIKEYQVAARSPYAGLGVQLTFSSLRISAARQNGAKPEEWQAIGEALAKLRNEQKHAIDPVTVSADLLAARGDFAGAAKMLRDATTANPGDPRLWSAMAMMLARGKGTLAAAEALGEGQLAAGESLDLRLTRARIWAEDIHPGRERRLASLEELAASASEVERLRVLSSLAELYESIHDEAGEKRVLNSIAAQNAQDLQARKRLFSLVIRGDDAPAKAHWREDIQRLEPSGQSARLIEALHDIATAASNDRRLADWDKLAKTSLAESPDNADACLLLAMSAERRGESVIAAKQFELAVDLDSNSQKCQEARLAYYLRTGQDELARRTLARLENDPRIPAMRFRSVIEGAILSGGPESLAKCLTWLAPHFKSEPRSAVWAGRLLESRGRVSDALATYRQTTEAQPLFADGWSARLLASAKLGEAEVNETMAAAGKALELKELFSVCAECGSAVRAKLPNWSPPVNNAEDRMTYAKACISTCEARGRLEDALPILTALAEDKETPAADAAWARQSLAAITAAIGSAQRKRDAISSLRDSGTKPKNIEEARSRVAALSVTFRAISGDDRRAVVREMIELLGGIVSSDQGTSNDWYQLAQLYRVAGDRSGCRKCLVEMTKREPNNLFYLAVRVDDLLDEQSMEDARPLIAQLVEGASDIRVASSAARFQTLANEPRAVLDVVDRYVRTADPGTVDGLTRQRQAAETLDQLTRLAASKGLSGTPILLDGACERYRASLRAYPDAVIAMAALLGFFNQVQQAFDELEKQKTQLNSLSLVTAGVAVLRSGHASPRQFQTVKAWIEEGLKASPDSVPLKLNLAEMHALRQDFATAEQVYREVLKADPRNLVALNNLAWILAPRAESAEESLRLADRAIELYGANAEILDTRARILIAAGKYDRAIADLNDAIGQSGTPLRYFHLALAQLKMSKPDDAMKTFREARARGLDSKAIHPSDLPTYKVLAERMAQ